MLSFQPVYFILSVLTKLSDFIRMINLHFGDEFFQFGSSTSGIATESFTLFRPLFFHIFNLLFKGFDFSFELPNLKFFVTCSVTFEFINYLFVFRFKL
jgi:hypothetical protein